MVENMQLLTVVVTCIFIALFIFSSKRKNKHFTRQHLDKIKVHQSKVHYLLGVIDNVFEQNSIWYMIAFGTLLGAVRHHGFIPWDDDGDILIKRGDIKRILSARHVLASFGVHIRITWKLVQFYCNDDEKVAVDAFIIDDVDGRWSRCFDPYDQPCIYSNSEKDRWWAKEFDFPLSWLQDRYRYNFDGIDLWGPQNAHSLLEYWYGKDYLTTCMSPEYDHQTLKYIDSFQVDCGELPTGN